MSDLPTAYRTRIVANDGHEYITATVNGALFQAREAILVKGDKWYSAWWSDNGVCVFAKADQIHRDTWKVATNE